MRLATAGKGESQPVASNSSEGGRQANRRVEIYLEPVVQG
jgi:outer membrane protein OmpA-like peptidoglycan-associated protein